MKILAIRGKNLASLAGEFEIDFSQPPLCDAGIFAISGSTGSGKSTILDAMCIALYATSPRLNRISGNNDITDTSNHTIKERDTRNILRKGTAGGYSEVDFKALDGHVYRARWSVRRARDNNRGKMQDSEHTLMCVTTGAQINGGKTETTAKISELIGLTYEQFTRAVLLAQGEFATFLKATAKEKAEILEKLTGTDIYSKISVKIYESHKQAASELKLIEEKIKDVQLLSDEEEKELLEQKNNSEKQQKEVEDTIKIIERKIAWIEREKTLSNNIQHTSAALALAKESLVQAREDCEFLARIDSTREIRETYLAAIQLKKQIENNKSIINNNNLSATELNKKFEDAKEVAKKRNEENEQINARWLAIQPKLKKAEEYETERRNITARAQEIEGEIREREKELAATTAEEEKRAWETNKLNAEQAQIKQWFDEHKNYSSIVPQSNIIIANINNIARQRKQHETKNNYLTKETALLENDKKRLSSEEKELERLNNILPTEIVSLRKKLIEGTPCPVCGSKHHYIQEIASDTLKEEELQAQKEKVAKRIEHLKNSIDETAKSIEINKALIKKIEEDIVECEKNNNTILSPLGDDAKFSDTTFAVKLQEITTLWEDYGKRDAEIENATTINKSRISALLQRKEELCKELNEKREKVTKAHKEIQEKTNEIINLIGKDSSAKSIETQFSIAIKQSAENFAKAIEERGEIMAALEKIKGSIAQTEKITAQLVKEQEKAKETIKAFLNNRKDALTLDELHKLMIADEREIFETRKKIEEIRNNILANEATLKEREKALSEHRQSIERPAAGETAETLSCAINQNTTLKKTIDDTLAAINSSIKQNENNKKLTAHYREEQNKKSKILERWSILNEAFGSATGDKFKIMAQGYTLDILLDYANKHLQEISRRYALERTSSDTLAIKVIDKDMFQEERSVYSLSGGESFLVSLAMALALSSLSSNKMNIESLFIDEGFGSLDNDTLRTAMEALENLQSLGRKVGVISHLQDMIERIPVKIKVVKEQEGKSRIKIEVS